MKAKTVIFLILILSSSCDDQRQNLDKAIIPLSPVNFTEVNSAYDDYNSHLSRSFSWESFSLIFSTNRNTGGNFDFISYHCNVEISLITGEFDISADQSECSLADAINSPDNELGPYFTFDYENDLYKIGNGANRFFYTTDVNGNNDIYYSYYTAEYDDLLPVGNPAGLAGINTSYDEGYLTIHPDEIAGRETVYFTSNRDNTFDIYRAVSEEYKLIDQSPGLTVNKVEHLSSDANDKCPYIIDDMMVFTSDRAGGFGGFDLWFSLYNGQEWSEPVNFGEKINTEYNEYRPIIIATDKDEFFNDMMIFSSDRPGGKGLFDLYYVGMSKRN
jgi:hypothetical protein